MNDSENRAARQARFGRCACGHDGLRHAGLTDFCYLCLCDGFRKRSQYQPGRCRVCGEAKRVMSGRCSRCIYQARQLGHDPDPTERAAFRARRGGWRSGAGARPGVSRPARPPVLQVCANPPCPTITIATRRQGLCATCADYQRRRGQPRPFALCQPAYAPQQLCRVGDCVQPVRAKGLCRRHYLRAWRFERALRRTG